MTTNNQAACKTCGGDCFIKDGYPCPKCNASGLEAVRRYRQMERQRRREQREALDKRLICVVCGERAEELYMLRDDVWLTEGGFGKQENAHLKCVEQKIGRKLTVEDFTDYPVNALVFFCWQKEQG